LKWVKSTDIMRLGR